MDISRRDLFVVVAGAALAAHAQTGSTRQSGSGRQGTSPRIHAGCQTRAYGSPITDRDQLLAVLDDLAATGYEGFETNSRSLQSAFDDPAPMRAEIEKRHLKLIGLHGTLNFIDPGKIEKERAQLDVLAKASQGLGAEFLILSSNGVPRDPEGKINADALKLRCAELNRAGAICRKMGFRLITHNHAKETENNGEEVNAVMAGTDPENLSMLMDASYVHNAHINVSEFIRRHLRRIAAIHIRDEKDGKQVDLGKGELDFAGIGQTLQETRWAGWLILEVNKQAGTTSREMVETGRKFMHDVMKV